MTFGLIYLGVFVILIWAFLLSSNLGAGDRYKFWPVSAPAMLQYYKINKSLIGHFFVSDKPEIRNFSSNNFIQEGRILILQ